MSTSNKKTIFFGTRGFKDRYSTGYSTQALWRKNGMPHYRVPDSKKILYKDEEILTWITSQKSANPDDMQDNTLETEISTRNDHE